jgi:hypothetical protein
LAKTLAVHEAVCAERWPAARPRPGSAASRRCSPRAALAGAGGDHQQQAAPGFDRVRLAAFTPFIGSAGYQHDFDDLVVSEPGVLDQGRRRRTVDLG